MQLKGNLDLVLTTVYNRNDIFKYQVPKVLV